MGCVLSPARKQLCRWIACFFFINSVIASFVIFAYLPQIETLRHISGITSVGIFFGYGYFFVAFFVQVSLFLFVCALFCVALALVFPVRWVVMSFATLVSGLFLFALIGETVTFRLYHMHYAVIGWQVYRAGALAEVIPLGLKEQAILMAAIFAAFLFEAGIAWVTCKLFVSRFGRALRVCIVSVIASWGVVYGAFALAQSNHLWGRAYRYAILRTGRLVPYLSELYCAAFQTDKNMKIIESANFKSSVFLTPLHKKLNYPLTPLVCTPPQTKMNVLIIGIDTWRHSAFKSHIMPVVSAFAKNAFQFDTHYSGGNCTGPGIFSLFYGLPPNYWESVLREKRSPVLMDQLQKAGYDINILLSAQSNFPRFDQTIFVHVKSLKDRTSGNTSLARDKIITKEFVSFLKRRKTEKPFFTFLFYDALHNYCEQARPEKNPFQPAVAHCDRFSLDASSDPKPYLNLYYNKAYFVDQQIKRVLGALKAHRLLKNTVVILTGDHGEQMNDAKRGLWGHASSYSRYQLHVPMIVYWPGKRPVHVELQTTHYDIAPTLLSSVLGCHTPVSQYSVGRSLFDKNFSDYFLAGSYGDYAIVHGNKALRIFPGGDFLISDLDSFQDQGDQYNQSVIKKAMKDLQRFFTPAP